jgi:hypothetical protein
MTLFGARTGKTLSGTSRALLDAWHTVNHNHAAYVTWWNKSADVGLKGRTRLVGGGHSR